MNTENIKEENRLLTIGGYLLVVFLLSGLGGMSYVGYEKFKYQMKQSQLMTEFNKQQLAKAEDAKKTAEAAARDRANKKIEYNVNTSEVLEKHLPPEVKAQLAKIEAERNQPKVAQMVVTQ